MASPVATKKTIDEEFAQFITRDPEAFFETILIGIRQGTQQPLDSSLINVQKLIFKNWFRRYEKELRATIERDSAIMTEHYNNGLKAGKLRMLRHLIGERWKVITPARLKRYVSAVEEERL